ncbi:MAG: acetyl-CoA decarbonylase/synthase complex subunit gamma [Syntrophorhabdaceae bacterium]|nr:acetyl-CoA decarbonylase/synthase complex subunit gamma [Syntrophorhabdaceae bacterium]
MALTGIEIFKLLPKTNCRDCNFPTCLAFAMALAAGKTELEACPHVSQEAKDKLSDASAPPIRQLTIGHGDYEIKVGGETVLFRHEKTFFNKPGFAILISDEFSDEEIEKRLSKLSFYQYERIGMTLKPELVALKHTGRDERFLNMVKKAKDIPYGSIIMCEDVSLMKEGLEILKGKRPLIYAANRDNFEQYGVLSKDYGCPVVARGNGIEDVAYITERLTSMGIKDIVIDTGAKSLKQAFYDQITIRRSAILKRFKPLGFPTIVFPCMMSDDFMKEVMGASVMVAKYAGIIVFSDFTGESLFPLLLQRLNIYTDPQRPMTTQEGIYPINNPDENSPVLVTCNFSLTYFIVSGEIENSRVPSWLCVMDTEGLSVLTAWAAGKFVGDLVGAFIKKCGIENNISHRKVIIPGYTASIAGDMEESLPGWEIIVGPREASQIPSFLKTWKH